MSTEHPITPPPELLDQWCLDFYELGEWRAIAIHAAQWGAYQAADRARAALSHPEPVAPTDEEIEEWADAATEVPLEEMDPDIHGWRRCFTAKEFGETIRTALARWGTPANNTRETHFDD